jgi:RNA polymerase sigma-70 factor (ECF subfamily)
MNSKSDANLVAKALSGSRESFCRLVRRYQDRVYGVVLGVLVDFDLALDAAQDAFLCAYCDLPKLRDPQRFGAWLCGIARNTAHGILRDRRRQASLAEGLADHGRTPERVPSPGELAAAAEERALVQQALQRTDDKAREALTLYHVDGLSYSQICGFLEISTGVLKGRLQRGRAALRKELTMVDRVCKDNAPDDAFARRLEEVIRVFGTKGPATNHIPSAWHQSQRDEIGRILASGEEGLRIDLALSHAGPAHLRHHAATHFGLRRDGRSLRELERMLEDHAARVRAAAVLWYAKRIHPDMSLQHPFDALAPAASAVAGVEKLLERTADENFNVRIRAVMAVGAYLGTGDPRVVEAMQQALDDRKHKVAHAAARLLGVPCRGCGRSWRQADSD